MNCLRHELCLWAHWLQFNSWRRIHADENSWRSQFMMCQHQFIRKNEQEQQGVFAIEQYTRTNRKRTENFYVLCPLFLTSTDLIKDNNNIKSLCDYLPEGRKKPSPVGEGGSRRLTDEELVWRLITPHPPLLRSPFPHWGRLILHFAFCILHLIKLPTGCGRGRFILHSAFCILHFEFIFPVQSRA